MPNNRKPHPIYIQLIDLILIQFSSWRWSWRRMIISGMLVPLMSIAALGLFAQGSGAETMAYILAGNVTLALMFENLGKVTSNFSFMKTTGALSHFAALPIRRYTLILATVISFLVLSFPAVFVTLFLGARYLNVSLRINPLVVLVVPLAGIPLAALGALIGASTKSPEEAGSIALSLNAAMLALGPVVIPPDRLPLWLVKLGFLSPATYAASALRQTLIGPITPRLFLDLGFLALFTAVVFILAGYKMNWRQE